MSDGQGEYFRHLKRRLCVRTYINIQTLISNTSPGLGANVAVSVITPSTGVITFDLTCGW